MIRGRHCAAGSVDQKLKRIRLRYSASLIKRLIYYRYSNSSSMTVPLPPYTTAPALFKLVKASFHQVAQLGRRSGWWPVTPIDAHFRGAPAPHAAPLELRLGQLRAQGPKVLPEETGTGGACSPRQVWAKGRRVC